MKRPFHMVGGLALMILAAGSCPAQSTDPGVWSVHAQTTIVDQWHYGFYSPYEGLESLQGSAENKHTLSATLFLGYGVGKGASCTSIPSSPRAPD